MTQPKARCVQCLAIIEHHDTHSRQRPRYCQNPQCRFDWNQNPICCRPGCRGPLTRDGSSGQKYHDDCALGCLWCGGELFSDMPGRRARKNPLQDVYCSARCREYAWEGQPMPTCPVCLEPTQFGKRLRNPPQYHPRCNPQDKRNKRRNRLEKMDNEHEFYYAWRLYSRPPLVPDKHGLPRPFDPFVEVPREAFKGSMHWPQDADHIPAWCEVIEMGWCRE